MASPAERPLQVAVVGSGPSGFYVAEALLRSGHPVAVDVIERLPTPFGLVRGGVAPDHAKTKTVTAAFDRIARAPQVRFMGNVDVGRDVSAAELREVYDIVVLACGAADSSVLGIPGESLAGVHGSASFVGWYNGHPDHRDLEVDLSHDAAVVIGHGNVGIDVCRILASPIERLASTDIAGHALETFTGRKVREIHLVGRRGPAHARFTNAELRELGTIPGCDVVVDPAALVLDEEVEREIARPGNEVRSRNVAILRDFAGRTRAHDRAIHIHFSAPPLSFEGEDRVRAAIFAAGAAAMPLEISCGLVVTSTGYRGRSLPGIPFDEARGIVPNEAGRVTINGAPDQGLYAAGWIKRGPSGVIGTNRADSAETVASILADCGNLPRREHVSRQALAALLAERRVRWISYEEWQRIDLAEIERGKARGKTRQKFTSTAECLEALSAT